MLRILLVLCFAVSSLSGAAQSVPGPPAPGARRPGLPGGRAAEPPRDPRESAVGTAVIRGRIVAADTGAPLRRVQVRAFSGEVRESRLASTDGDGRFELRDLPAGRWELVASKAGFVTLRYGQRRPFESGRPIELSDGDATARADFALPRGAVVTGRILDEYGDPVAGARVMVMRYQSFQGSRRLAPTSFGDESDDTGAYRIYGLAPGEYYVSAVLRMQGFADASSDTTGYAPTYYPGTGNVAEAQRVTVPLGQEVTNISFALLPTKTVRITGTVITSEGGPLSNGFVMLQESLESSAMGMMMSRSGARVRPDGSFTIANVSPGSYTLVVQTPGREDSESASLPITVGSDDLTGINIVTSRGATVIGTIVQAADASGKAPLAGVQVMAQPPRFEPMMGFRPGRVESDGTFRLTGVRGRRLFRLVGLPPAWTLKAVLLNGDDVTDRPMEFRGADEISGLQLVVTDKVSEVSGKVTDARGEPTRDYTVIVFPEDSSKWSYPSRFVRSGRADQQGLFRIRGLPAEAEYLAVAVDYLEDGEGGDPQFLDQIKDRATRFSLAEGEIKALDLKLINR